MALAVSERDSIARATERVECSSCGTAFDPRRGECAAVPSNVRAFKDEIFHVWRCVQCRSLHCLEVVELSRYYKDYPIQRTLTTPARLMYDNLLSRLTAQGFTRESRLLDYGCGWGVFLEFLRERGYANVVGYDPYSAVLTFRDPSCLQPAAYDYILMQDVLEHVEDPRAVLGQLNTFLKPGGRVLIGTPCADHISLHHYRRYWLQLHPPYHLHIYTRKALEQLAAPLGWHRVAAYDRPYYDTKHLGMNARALSVYRWFSDGTLDACFDNVPTERLRRSKRFMVMALFGYWFKRKGEVTLVFQKRAEDGGVERSTSRGVRSLMSVPRVSNAAANKVDSDRCRDLYLDLLKRSLLGLTYEDASYAAPTALTETPRQEAHNQSLRLVGQDWPAVAPSMIGVARMENLRHCIESVLREGVPGDFIETGVWRGGAVIFMRGVLKAHAVADRTVWAADSFDGLPPPDAEKYPHDVGLHLEQYRELAVPLDEVRRNFERYDLLDGQVRFLPGWFRDTLPNAPIRTLAILRLDGDLYESTMDALDNLYHRLSPGGYVIVDDYSIPACRQAVHDFRQAHAVTEPIMPIDWTGVFWKRAR